VTESSKKSVRPGWRRWAVLFLLSLGIALIWTAPASLLPGLLNRLFPGEFSPITVLQTRDRLWAGGAGQVVIRPSAADADTVIVLEDVRWRLQWSSLLSGRLCLHSLSTAEPRSFDGDICVSAGGVVTVDDLVFSLPAADLARGSVQGPPLLQALSNAMRLEGNITGQIAELTWQAGDVQSLQSEGLWVAAALSMAVADPRTGGITRHPLRMGDLPWYLQSVQPGEFELRVEAPPTTADLTLQLLSHISLDGAYDTQLTIGVQPATPPYLRDLLRLMAEETAPGVYQLRLHNN